jgi:disulfide bond formation protein DsbB
MIKTRIEQTPDNRQLDWNLLFASWIIACIATLGSLFFSEIMGLKPCVLCWWQRIFMYPLVFILPAGLYPLDRNIVRYTLPLAVIGWLFAVYHYLLYIGVIPEDLAPCDQEASCKDVNLEMFGFITIPMLSILSYTGIIILLAIFRHRQKTVALTNNRINE